MLLRYNLRKVLDIASLAQQLMEKHLSRYKIDEQAIRELYPTYFC